jgi:uncharacterized protein
MFEIFKRKAKLNTVKRSKRYGCYTSFFKRIDQVNIGGLPFLPNTTRLVEQFIEKLIEKSTEEIQKEGILPLGTKEEWISSLDSKVFVANVSSEKEYHVFKSECIFVMPVKNLKKGWQEAKYIALCLSKGVSKEYNGITYYSKIEEVQFIKWKNTYPIELEEGQEYALFKVSPWKTLGHIIRPVQYRISVYVMSTLNTSKYSN